jgi:methionyl-tRNA formyltransferase
VTPVRLVVFAYHTIGSRALETLLSTGDLISTVVTHADDPAETIWFESVADLAKVHALPVYAPPTPNTGDFAALLSSLRPDLFVSVWYRRLLSRELLAIPRLGAVNLHGSLLPRYRGRAPLNWVLVNGEERTGVTLHWMVEEADAGDIIAQEEVAIDPADTAPTLYAKLVGAGADLLRRWYPAIVSGTAPRVPQDPSRATVFGRRRPEDGRILWNRSARELSNLVRGVTHPFPGAFAALGGRRLFVWAARVEPAADRARPGTVLEVFPGEGMLVATGAGALLLSRVALEGEPEVRGDSFAESHGLGAGASLKDGP